MLLIFFICAFTGTIVANENSYSYIFSQCSISFGEYYSMKWEVIGKRIHFQLILSNIPKNDDFWIGIGFSKIQVNSPVNENEVLAILKLQDTISLKIFNIKNGKIESIESMKADRNEEVSFTYAYMNPTLLESNFTRSLHPDHLFNNSINDCAIWTFYTIPILMNETFVDPVLDALICNLTSLCMPYSIDNSSNRLHIRSRRQTIETSSNRQTKQISKLENPKLYNPVINPYSPNYTAVLRQNQEALLRYKDPTCTLPDPYWCKNYVKQYVNWQQTYNNLSIKELCAPLKASVANAHNRCCQAIRSTGC